MPDTSESVCERKLQELGLELNSLEDESRNVRLKALEKIHSTSVKCKSDLDSFTTHEILMKIYKPILRAFSDGAEKCRETAVNLINDFWIMDDQCKEIVPFLIPTIVQRLGQHDITEPAEEIRLMLMQLLIRVVDKMGKEIAPYLNDLIKILRVAIIDPYPEIKKEACKCASLIAVTIPQYFHQQSETLIDPLMKTLTHQHAKVRIRCLETIGDVVQYGDNKSVNDVIPHLAQRLFDHSPQVRVKITEVVGRWIVELPDRYSFFYRFIPILLTGLADDVPENEQTAQDLWFAAGAQFEVENEEDLKDELDFKKPAPIHYPPDVQRPNLGCRTLVARNFSKILPALSNDMDDWLPVTRVKAGHLLYVLLLNGEDSVTQQLNYIISALCRVCCEDQDEDALKKFVKAAETIGYFIAPKIYLKLILEHLKVCPTAANLMVLAALIRGSYKEDLSRHLDEICDLVSKGDVCEDSRSFYQLQLLTLVKAIASVMQEKIEPVSFQLFRITLTVYALASEDYVRHEVAEPALKQIAEAQNIELVDLFRNHLKEILEMLKLTQNSWLPSSPQRFILDAILSLAGPALGEELDLLIDMLKENLKTEKDGQMRLRFFISLSHLMLEPEKSLDSIQDFDRFILVVIQDMILPNLLWHAGRTSGALRSAAMSCFWCLFRGGKLTAERLHPVLDVILTQLLCNLEDDLQQTRYETCRVLERLFVLCRGHFDLHRLHNIYPQLLKRMDDAKDDIRVCATHVFRAYFAAFEGNFETHLYRAHIEETYSGLLLHLDDPLPKVQYAVLDLLIEAADICPKILECKTQDVRLSHRSTAYCDQLLAPSRRTACCGSVAIYYHNITTKLNCPIRALLHSGIEYFSITLSHLSYWICIWIIQMSSSWRKIGLILWKNWLFRRRHYIMTALEIVFPTLFAVVLFMIRGSAEFSGRFSSRESNTENLIPGTLYEPYPLEDIYISGQTDQDQDVVEVFILYYPNTPAALDLLVYIQNYATENTTFSFEGVESESEIDTRAAKANIMNEKMHGAILFEGLDDEYGDHLFDDELKCTIRLNLNLQSKLEIQWHSGELEVEDLSNGPPNGNAIYQYTSFATIQHAIAIRVIEKRSGNSQLQTNYDLTLQAFPYPAYLPVNPYTSILITVLPLFITLSYIFTVPITVRLIVREKEIGIKELMKLMGIATWIQWFGWFVSTFIIMALSAIIIVALLCATNSEGAAVLDKSAPELVYVVLLFYIAASICLCFFISTLFNKPTVAAAITVMLWLVSFCIPYYALYKHYRLVSIGNKMLLALIPNMAMASALTIIAGFEAQIDNTKSTIPNRQYQIDITKSTIPNRHYQIGNTKSAIPNWQYQIDITKSTIPNRQYQIDNSKSAIPNRHYQIDNTKSTIPNRHYQIDNTKSTIPNWQYQIDNTKSTIPNRQYQIGNTKSAIPNWQYQIDITKSTLPNRHYQIDNTKSTIPNRQYQIDITKSTIPNRQYQIDITKSTIPNWQYQIDNTKLAIPNRHYQIDNTKSTIQIDNTKSTIPNRQYQIDNTKSTIPNRQYQIDNTKSTIPNRQYQIDNTKSTIPNRQYQIDNTKSTIPNRQYQIDNTKSTIPNRQYQIDNTKSAIQNRIYYSPCGDSNQGIRWNNLNEPVRGDNVSMLLVLLMMIVDALLYLLLTWYVGNVRPGAYGVPKPFYFFLTTSYWRLKNEAKSLEAAKEPILDASRFEEDPTGLTPSVVIKNLSKTYGWSQFSAPVVDNLCLNIYEGQITALLGHNGAGKTTTMSILTGMIPPSKGTAYVNGYDVRTQINDARNNIGLCPQSNMLFDKLTVKEHLKFFGKVHSPISLKIDSSKGLKREIISLLWQLQLDNKKNTLAMNLSGGMKRKLNLGIALIGEPKVVILDEPTSGMDPEARREIWDLLKELRGGRCIVLSTHFMDEADVLADRIAIMTAGHLQCCGSPIFLKAQYGAGYHLKMSLVPHSPVKEITKIVASIISSSTLEEHSESDVSYILSSDETARFPHLFTTLEAKSKSLGIKICLSVTTMEEVFLKQLSRDLELAGKKIDYSDIAYRMLCTLPPQYDIIVSQIYKWSDDDMKPTKVEEALIEEYENLKSRDQRTKVTSGAGYHLKMSLVPHSPVKEITKIVASIISSSTLEEHSESDVSYILSSDETARFPHLFTTLEAKSKSLGIKNFGLSVTTMEEVFLKVEDPVHTTDAHKHTPLVSIPQNDDVIFVKKTGKSIRLQQFHGLILKRFYYARCRFILLFFQLFLPFITILLALFMNNGLQTVNDEQEPGLVFDLDDYRHCAGFFYQTQGFDENLENSFRASFSSRCDVKNLKDKRPIAYLRDTGFSDFLFYRDTLLLGAMFDLKSDPQTINILYNEHFYHTLPTALNVVHNTLLKYHTGNDKISLLVENKPIQQTHVAGKDSNNAMIKDDILPLIRSIVMGIFISFGLTLLTASFIVFVIHERVSKCKHVQLMTGVGGILFWICHLVWDLCFCVIACIIAVVLFAFFDDTDMFNSENIEIFVSATIFLLLIVYCWASICFVYFTSYFFELPAAGFTAVTVINLAVGLIFSVWVFVLEVQNHRKSDFKWILYLVPNFSATVAFMKVVYNADKNAVCMRPDANWLELICNHSNTHISHTLKQCCADRCGHHCFVKTRYFTIGLSGMGSELMALLVMGLVYLLIIWVIESAAWYRVRHCFNQLTTRAIRRNNFANKDSGMDRDVLAERYRVHSVASRSDYLIVRDLTKYFKNLKAVDGLSFGVEDGTCFGLLGINGAGKTTTFRQLTGDLLIDSGDAIIQGSSITQNKSKYLMHIGYCPQFDALLDHLTGRELLRVFAYLYGIPKENIKDAVENILMNFDLMNHANKRTFKYSGGNKRKLSAALAFIGRPLVVFLDEPTTGVDPVARRKIWNMIKELINGGTAVVLTSHSMEECEVLCSRVGIMVNGQFKCIGGIQYLKNKFSEGYTILAKLKQLDANQEELEAFIKDNLPSAVLQDEHQVEELIAITLQRGLVVYVVRDARTKLADLFVTMELAKDRFQLEDYSVTQVTLEQVFLSFARRQGVDTKTKI
uniref:ABC transporter domain-containing protein n=1 Tax=Strigamia maritima TaxID=126957 RepID=T1JE66_STRMM